MATNRVFGAHLGASRLTTSGGTASGPSLSLPSITVWPAGLTPTSNEVMVADDLTGSNFYPLVENDLLALRIPGWIPAKVCNSIADAIIAAEDRTTYKVDPAIGKLGDAFYDSNDDPIARELYFANADRLTRRVREIAAPYLSPLDKLRLRITEIHPPGTCVEAIDGRTMSVGIARSFADGGAAGAHHDVLEEDAPEAASPRALISQIAWNTYLRLPTRGGHLALWAVEMDADAFRARLVNGYAIDENSIGCLPAIEFVPEQGELVGFNCRAIHAVRRCFGTRVTLGAFTSFRGRHAPVGTWA
jgi:hypothetical protein